MIIDQILHSYYWVVKELRLDAACPVQPDIQYLDQAPAPFQTWPTPGPGLYFPKTFPLFGRTQGMRCSNPPNILSDT